MSGIARSRLTLLAGVAASLLIGAVDSKGQPHLVKDINPGSASGTDFWGAGGGTEFATVGSTLFFAADDGVHGQELWKTDGTEAGTVLVSDINPGSGSSSPRDLTRVGDVVFFRAWDPAHGYELWKSDGTTAGTVLVKDIVPGAQGGLELGQSSPLFRPVAMGNRLFFTASIPSQGYSLWTTDGTEAGTVQIKAGESRYLCPFGGAVYFGISPGGGEGALWRTDGTEAGTTLVKDLYPLNGPFDLTEFNGMLYFIAENGDFPDLSGLWRSDGTAAGTSLFYAGLWPVSIANGRLFLSGATGLYVTDGTTPGTKLLKDNIDVMGRFVGLLGNAFFAAYDPHAPAYGVWTSDGTEAGTVMFKDRLEVDGRNLTSTGCALYFRGSGYGQPNRLWTSDGTPEGTLVRQLTGISTPVMQVGSTLYYQVDDSFPSFQYGRELWALNVDEPFVSFAAPTSTAAEAAGVHTITVRLTTPCEAPTTAPVSVSYTTVNGSAYHDYDYVTASGTLTFPAGSVGGSLLSIPVTIIDDGIPEVRESFFVELSGPLVLGNRHEVTITEELPPPTLAIGDVAMPEGNEGLTPFALPVTLSAPSSYIVSVRYATAEGSAKAGVDFVASSAGVVVFPPGSTTQTITVPVIGDRVFELPERFTVNLSDALNATIAGGQSQATILNDDPAGLSIADLPVIVEPPTGSRNATFTVTLSPKAGAPVAVEYSTAAGTAIPGSDYEDTSGTFTFTPGTSSLPINVLIHSDDLTEGVETFEVNLANATGAAIAYSQAIGSIYDHGQYFTLVPCRVLDTRNPANPLAAGESRGVTLAGVCGIPATATAVSLNLTVTQPTTAGNLRLYPADVPVPLVSTLNYAAGQTRANNAVAALSATGALAIRCAQASGTAHVIVDVNGYFE